MDPVNLGNCPRCSRRRSNLVLIEEVWIEAPDTDPGPRYVADARVDAIRSEQTRARPREQFIQETFCENCGHALVPDEALEK